MNWELLLLLACPLMMLFCMKGMLTGNKDQKVKEKLSKQDLRSLQIQMADLTEQNEEPKKELSSLKRSGSTNKERLIKGNKAKGS